MEDNGRKEAKEIMDNHALCKTPKDAKCPTKIQKTIAKKSLVMDRQCLVAYRIVPKFHMNPNTSEGLPLNGSHRDQTSFSMLIKKVFDQRCTIFEQRCEVGDSAQNQRIMGNGAVHIEYHLSL